jgi:hypothetical protein
MPPETVGIFLSILGVICVFGVIVWAVVCTISERKIRVEESPPRT